MPVNAIKRFGAGYRKKTWAKPPTGLWVVVDTVVEKVPKVNVPTRPVVYNGVVLGQRGLFQITNVTSGVVVESFLTPPFSLSNYGATDDEILVDFYTFSEEGPSILLPIIVQIVVSTVGTLSRTGATVTLTPATWDTAGVAVTRQKFINDVPTALSGLTFDVGPGDSYYVVETASKLGSIASAPSQTATGSRPVSTPALVGSKNTGWPGTTSNQTVSLTDLTGGTDSAPQEGDVVIVSYFMTFGTGSPTLSMITSGYTTLAEVYVADTYQTRTHGYMKRMGAVPDTSFIVSGTGNSSNAGGVIVLVFRGVDPTTPLDDVAVTTASSPNGGRPTPPAITPTTANSLIVMSAGAGGATPALMTSGLSNFVARIQGDTYTVNGGAGTANWVGGTYTPIQWGGSTTSNQASWTAFTLVLKPAP